MRYPGTIIDRFISKIWVAASGCWEWVGVCSSTGYGSFYRSGRMVRAHRYAARLFIGEPPAGLNICHRCDNRRCVNPQHLFFGTMSDNMLDASRKGRLPCKAGKDHWNYKHGRSMGRYKRKIAV